MKMIRHVATLILFYCVARRAVAAAPQTKCQGVFYDYSTVLISADVKETEYYTANLASPIQAPAGTTVCLLKYGGYIMGQAVVVVAANEGPLNAALCLTELLQCGTYVKEVIWSGTAGTSVQVGGVVNPGNCTASNSPVVRLGDVCVSPFSVSWDCWQASYSQACSGYPNVCSQPDYQTGPLDNADYEDCFYNQYLPGSVNLTQEIIDSSNILAISNALSDVPARGPVTTAYEEQFFGNLSESTGLYYPLEEDANGALPFTIYDHTQCMETTSLFYWYGAPYDRLARVFEAQIINDALNLTVTPEEVVGVTAEEATGISAAMYAYSKYEGNAEIPFTIIRGLSDYSHGPLVQTASGSWEDSPTFTFDDNNDETYAFTRQTFSTVVFNLLKGRCLSGGGAEGGSATCTLPAGINLGTSSSSK